MNSNTWQAKRHKTKRVERLVVELSEGTHSGLGIVFLDQI